MRKHYPLIGAVILVLCLSISFDNLSFEQPPGLTNPEPIGQFLNGNFPDISPEGEPYVEAFPNLRFDSPLTFTPVPNSNILIVGQRDGKIYWFDNRNDVPAKNLLADLSNEVGVVWDGGFLGLAIHPEFGNAGKNYFYLYYTTKDGQGRDFPNGFISGFGCNREDYWGGFLVLKRIEVNPNNFTRNANNDLVMMKKRMFSSTHRGGGIAFGKDGFLYIPTGDQSAYSKPQNTSTNLDGGVLRIDVDSDATKSHAPIRRMPQGGRFADEISGVGYYIPDDNPFLSPDGSRFEEYYTVGHRNPHRMTMDRVSGTFYIGEIGEGTHEEINVISSGKNYGWPLYEGYQYSGRCTTMLDNMPHEGPLVAFPRSQANAIIGGYVYRGSAMPDFYGKYICADYGTGEEIWAVDTSTGSYELITQFSPTNIISFGEDNSGELYLLSQGDNVKLYKLRQGGEPEGSFPELLSETGAFKNLTTLEPSEGVLPYELIEPFWSDGAEKQRWMAIPNNGTHNTAAEQIAFSENGDWQYPTGSVLIKHFELPVDERNPAITRRLETRFSVKASNGSFYYLTYKWNNQQTDATLLTSGLRENVPIINADGSNGVQAWDYPSTQDCISCHNPATGGTLGTRTRYLNSDITYEKTGLTANQLVTLSHLGILNEAIDDADVQGFQTYKTNNDTTASLDEKARSYLDLNCAYCHRPGGTGDRAQFDLRLFNTLQQTGLLSAGTNSPIGIPGEKILVPGDAATSILYHRTNSTDPTIMMPPLAKNKVDDAAVAMLEDWINQMNPDLEPQECEASGTILLERYNGISGIALNDLFNAPNYPDNPSNIQEISSFEITPNTGDDYGVKVSGFLCPPESGVYYFWVSGDDESRLDLSTDRDPINANTIASVPGWTSSRDWLKFPSQKSVAIQLIKGQRYYIQAFMKESGGGDNLAVGWRRPSDGNGQTPTQVIPGNVLSPWANNIFVDGITVNPESITLTEGENTQLTATVTPSNATDTSIFWTSSDPSIARVDDQGNVTAVSEGTATITATTNDGGFEALVEVSVEPVGPVQRPFITTWSIDDPSLEGRRIVIPTSENEIYNYSVDWGDGNTSENVTGDAIHVYSNTGLYQVSISGDFPRIYFSASNPNRPQLALVSIDQWGDIAWSSMQDAFKARGLNILAIDSPDLSQVSSMYGMFASTGGLRNDNGSMNNWDVSGIVDMGSLFAATSLNNIEISGWDVSEVKDMRAMFSAGGGTAPDISNWDVGKVTDMSFMFWTTKIEQSLENWDVSNVQDMTNMFGRPNNGPQSLSDENYNKTLMGWSQLPSLQSAVELGARNNYCEAADARQLLIDAYGWVINDLGQSSDCNNAAVIGVTLSPEIFSIAVGESQALNAEVLPSNASNKEIIWYTSNDAVASINENGEVTALSEGTSVLTARTVEGGFEAYSTLTVFESGGSGEAVTGVTLEPEIFSMPVGESQTLNAQVIPSNADNQALIWYTSDNTVASIDDNGLVIALAEGSSVLTARTVDGGFEAYSTLTVLPGGGNGVSVTGVTLQPEIFSMTVGELEVLNAEVIPSNADSQDIIWYTSNANVASISAMGEVNALSEGTTVLTARTVDGGFEAYSTLTVLQSGGSGIDVTGVTLAPESLSLPVGESFSMTGQVIPSNADNQSLIWYTSDANVVGINDNGVITALAEGTSIITARTLDGGYEAYSNVTVFEGGQGISVTGVTLTPELLSIAIGESITLSATVMPANADNTDLIWYTSNANVASISGTGELTALNEGVTVITSRTVDGGFEAYSTVTSVDAPPGSLKVIIGELANQGSAIADLRVAPNPIAVNGNLSLSFVAFADEQVTVEFWDYAGRLLKQDTAMAYNGYNILEVGTNNMSSGNYMIAIRIKDELYAKQIIIK